MQKQEQDNTSSQSRAMTLCHSQPKLTWIALFIFFVLVNFALYKHSTIIEHFLPEQFSLKKPVVEFFQGDNRSTSNAHVSDSPAIIPQSLLLANASFSEIKPRNVTGNPSNQPLSESRGQGTASSEIQRRPFRPFSVGQRNSFSPGQGVLKSLLQEEVVNPHNFRLVIEPNVTCEHRVIDVAICVPISRKNFRGRQVIRETWGSYAYKASNNAILVFFIGSGAEYEGPIQTGQDIQGQILEESKKYGDILQESYIDSYNNLSLKSVSILKWARSHCAHTRFVLKADDDMYVNIPYMMNLLRNTVVQPSTPGAFIMGCKQVGAMPQRSMTSKWYTPFAAFSENTYPAYVSGTTYVMTIQAVGLLYETSLRTPLFWLEDIYITGICARKARITVLDNIAFTYGKPDATGCVFRTRVSGHRYNLEQILKIHKELYDPNLKCV